MARQRAWSVILWLARAGVAVLCLTWLIKSFGFSGILEILRQSAPAWLAAGILCAVLQPPVCTGVQWLVAKSTGVSFSYGKLLRVGLVGSFLNTAFVGRFVHDAYFIATLRKSLSTSRSVFILVADYAFNLLALALWTLLLALCNTGWIMDNPLLALAVSGGMALLLVGYLLASYSALLPSVLRGLPLRVAPESLERVRAILRPGTTSARGVGLYLLRNFLLCALYYCFFRAVHAAPESRFLLFIVPLVGFIAFIPVSISGLGVREASLVLFFAGPTATPEQCVAVGLLVFATWQVIKLSGGLVFLGQLFVREPRGAGGSP